ncbi:MAG: sensor histidine kinase, partial [Boseongicola sp.]
VTLNEREETLGAILDRAVAATELIAKDGALKIKRSGVGENLLVFTDADRLAQVFINLIANAQKYCENDAPLLTVSVHEVGGRWCVDFADNGPGIPEAAQKVIFEKFARVSDEHAAGGAGLGLAICREVMARLGGSIVYLPGQGGAAFRVILPKQERQAA